MAEYRADAGPARRLSLEVVREHIEAGSIVSETLEQARQRAPRGFAAVAVRDWRIACDAVADDHLVDVGLRELLRLDLVLLRRTEEVVEERHVELEDLDELEDAAVGDVELAVEVEGARIGVGAVDGDLAVVDVAGEL